MTRTPFFGGESMRLISNRHLAAAIAAAGLAGGLAMTQPAAAMPALGTNLATTVDSGLVQDVQYFYGGREYCWYLDGWHGPGYYYCGYAWRRGLGWGGGYGWRGWGGGDRGFRRGGPGRGGRIGGGHAGGHHH
jgi:hypothetical protein